MTDMDSDSRQSDEEVIERMPDYEKLKHDVVAHTTAYGTVSGVMAGDLLAALNATESELKYALSRITELERERDASDAALLSSICKEPPCMYGSNERVYIMSLIEARRRSAT
jgi:hypothetical protein